MRRKEKTEMDSHSISDRHMDTDFDSPRYGLLKNEYGYQLSVFSVINGVKY